MAQIAQPPNRLIHEKSPYLLQHAHNPVDWFPWGDEAFQKARNEHKPIFLSVGYSTCHWCHVMERESFENASIAALMNRFFVPIKVDREERPDIDRVYMAALQAMGQNGGWPMSMFLTPDLKPFFGGTYFPPDSRHGRAGFPDVLQRVHDLWEKEPGDIEASAGDITTFLLDNSVIAGGAKPPSKAVLDTCYSQLQQTYDQAFGGFGQGAKFPRPVVFNFLLRYYYRTGESEALEMTEYTLQKMAVGGMCDHIGGGFHRYTVDPEWRVPHFEKMLYDQAQIVRAYLDLYLLTHDAFYASVVRDVLAYVQRDLTGPSGGLYSAEDADSPRPESPEEKGEGAFYIWTREEILRLLGEQDGRLFCYYYGVEEAGNAPFDPQNEFTGRNILYVAHPVNDAARVFNLTEDAVRIALARSRSRLFDARAVRPRPHRDDKILASWNGLMISAFARAARVLQEPAYLNAASRAAGFVAEHLLRDDGILLRRYRDGEAKFEGHLEDYAFMAQGLLDLYEASFEVRWLQAAAGLTGKMIDLFWDGKHGGFFDTSGRDASVVLRLKEQYDGAEPAGNSIAVMILLRLARLMDRDEWENKTAQTLALFGSSLEKHPVMMPQMAVGLDLFLSEPRQIVIAGRLESEDTANLLREVSGRYLPDPVVLLVNDQTREQLLKIAPFAASLQNVKGKATAYVCHNFRCELPATEAETFRSILDEKPGTAAGS